MSRLLSKYLVSPQKLCNIIDWKRTCRSTIMSLDIKSDRIGVGISSHVGKKDEMFMMNAIQYNSTHTNNTQLERNTRALKEVQSIIEKEKIDGCVVNWPLEFDGRFGKPCGKVLHFLDFLLEHNIISKRCPFVLWTPKFRVAKETTIDEWGRSSSFCFKKSSAASVKDYYKYSEDLSHAEKKSSWDSSDALALLYDFLDCHFALESKEEVEENEHKSFACSQLFDSFHVNFEEYETKGAYIQANLL